MAEQKRKKNSTASKAAAKQGGSRGGKGKKSASRPIRREVGACVCLFLGAFMILCCFGVDAVILNLMQENYFPNARIDWFGCGIGIVMFYLILKRNWSVPKVITLAAVLGMVGYGVLGIG